LQIVLVSLSVGTKGTQTSFTSFWKLSSFSQAKLNLKGLAGFFVAPANSRKNGKWS
jgi:hypothetical protein